MYFKVSWDEDFDSLMMHLWSKYGKEMFTVDGIGEQMDLHKFSKKFFNDATTTADASVDANANVSQRTSIEYNFEMPKPLRRYNSYFCLWKQLRKDFGLELANKIIEAQLNGEIYVNDFTDVNLAYCFNYSTNDIKYGGLKGLSDRPYVTAPKSLDVFIRQVEQFMVVAANSTLGATGFSDALIVASTYVDKIIETGRDGHINIGKNIDDIKTYVKEKLTEFIYTVNWSFRGNQSPFSNLSVYDKPFLEHLCPDYGANIETVQMLQELYLDAMNDEMARTPLTFPVTTACFCTDEDNNLKDKEFAKFIAEKNLKYGFINIYNGKTTNLSSCCFSGNTKVLTCDSNGVFFGTFKDLYESPYADHRKNFTVFHNGSWCRGKLIKLPSRPMYRVKTVTGKVLEVTDNHLHLTTRGDVSTVNLTTGDYLAINQRALPEKRSVRRGLTYSQGFVIGLYAGDGSRYKREGMESYTVTFSLNNGKKAQTVEKIRRALREWGLDDTVSRFDDGKLMSIVVNSKEFYDITKEYVSGDYANTKSFTPNVFLESSDFRRGIKDGWYMSDGGNSQRIYSSSHELIETGEALFTTLGIATRIDVSDRRGEVEIKGEVFTRNFPIYCIRWYEPSNKRRMDGVYVVRNNTMYVKIQSIEPMDYDDSHVYCFEMSNEDEPYFTLPNGIITHNCRLRSSTDNPYFNTFGAGSTKIGSLGVVTVSFPRAAMKAVDKADASLDPELKEQYFMENLHDLFDMECMINSAKRKLISKRIELGAAPLYTHGYMALSKQYSTFGIVGLNEAVEIMGYDILTKEGQAFVSRVLDTINEWVLSAENQYKAPHNVEQVPSEGSAVKLATKDKMMGYDCGVPFYSNQFIPLVTPANMLDRIRLQGMFDAKMSGGAICHINVAEEITDPDKMVKLMEYAAKCGVVYWAVNYRIRMCENHHTWVGTEKCPVCGKPYTDEITRVVGFFTNTKHWNKTRREHDWPNRQFYSSI